MSLPELIGQEEACRILGVKPQNLRRDVPDMPPSLQEKGEGHSLAKRHPVFERVAVERLAERRAKERAER